MKLYHQLALGGGAERVSNISMEGASVTGDSDPRAAAAAADAADAAVAALRGLRGRRRLVCMVRHGERLDEATLGEEWTPDDGPFPAPAGQVRMMITCIVPHKIASRRKDSMPPGRAGSSALGPGSSATAKQHTPGWPRPGTGVVCVSIPRRRQPRGTQA